MECFIKYKWWLAMISVCLSLQVFAAEIDVGDIAFEDNSTEKSVTVFAAAGTMAAMNQIADQYENRTGQKVFFNYASSSTLARQMESGADFDVFISANPRWMAYVQDKTLIEAASRHDLLTDRLVLIAPAGFELTNGDSSISKLLASSKGLIAVGDASHVPCGMYAKEALNNLNCWSSIQDRIIPASSVRVAQQYVESGQCELGIVYHAGAMQSNKVKIIAVFDEALHSPIRFSVASSINSTTGKQFTDFLYQSSAMNTFTKAGFTPCKSEILTSAQTASIEPAFEVNTWQTLLISLKVATACTVVVAAPGILLGYLLARKSFPCKSIVNAVIHLPMVIPPVVAGYLALILLGKNTFLGQWFYNVFGISIAFSWIGAVVVSGVMGFPLLIRSVKSAVEMIDSRYASAAGTLGASPLRAFITITIPLAGPGILAGLVLAFARCLGEFGATAMFAGNIPNKTQTLSLAIFNFTQIPGAESVVLKLVGLSVLLSFAAIIGSEFLNQRMKHLAGATI